jgi:hypothetical protein
MTVKTMSSQDQAPYVLLEMSEEGSKWSCRWDSEKQAYSHFCYQDGGLLYGRMRIGVVWFWQLRMQCSMSRPEGTSWDTVYLVS